MEKKLVKELIDRIISEEISDHEMAIILEEIKSDSELQNYYHETLKLKDQFQQIAEEQPYLESDLEQSRLELFKKIESESNGFRLIHLIAAVITTIILTSAFFLLNNQNPNLDLAQDRIAQNHPIEGNIISMNVENISNERIIFTGKAVKDFQISGFVGDENIQEIIKKTALYDPNINNRVKALSLLQDSKDNTELLLSLIQNDYDNAYIKTVALNKLSKINDTDLSNIYIKLLKEQNDRALQIKLIELLKAHQNTQNIYDQLQSILDNSDKKELKSLIQKEMIEL